MDFKMAALMVPTDGRTWWWYWDQTGDQVKQTLGQNKAILTDISPYIDIDHGGGLKFAVTMEPSQGQPWWWYWGLTGDQVSQTLGQNKAMLTRLRPYEDTDSSLKFAVTMEPSQGQPWWWYWGLTGDQVAQNLDQNKAILTDISPYIADDRSLKFAVIMKPSDGRAWWWYAGLTGDQVVHTLDQNKAVLTRIRPYEDTDGSLKFAVTMEPSQDKPWWWYWNQTGNQVMQNLDQNKAVLAGLSAYLPFALNVGIIREDSKLQDGDILLFVPTDLTGNIINDLSGRNGYSHAGLVCGTDMIDIDNTVDSTKPQAESVPLSASLTRKHVGVRIGLSAIQAFQLCQWARQHLGEGENWAGLFTDGQINQKGTHICTMFIMHGLDAIGFNRAAIGLEGFISPNHIARRFNAPPGSSL